MKVAVVDDNKSALASLARLIKSAGIEVLSFSSAPEFLHDPNLGQLDCAVTDLRMPGVDGLKLQEMLAETVPYLSVVFITGHGDIPKSVKAIRGGAMDFLEKPVDDKALLEAVLYQLHRALYVGEQCGGLGDVTAVEITAIEINNEHLLEPSVN